MSKTVYVGMSGGVDSPLTAALLIEQGYKVPGVFMKNWTQDIAGFECPWREDFEDAKRTAVKLKIDFKVFDFQKEYRQKVVDYMISEYKAGRTPNPDIMCNQEVKFKLFLDTATEQGANFIATGHYAKIIQTNSRYELHQPQDKHKDQTYFLYRVSEKALAKALMPLGTYKNKKSVRMEATKRDLPTAAKKDSQGICFVGKVGIKDFLSEYVKTEPGAIVDEHNQILGEHEGAIFYTIGQRHGLNIGGGLPYYVTDKDIAKNIVYVTTDLNSKSLWKSEINLTDLFWINQPPTSGKTYQLRYRHGGKLIDCIYKKNKLILAQEQKAIAPGQSAVLYEDMRVVGGGIII